MQSRCSQRSHSSVHCIPPQIRCNTTHTHYLSSLSPSLCLSLCFSIPLFLFLSLSFYQIHTHRDIFTHANIVMLRACSLEASCNWTYIHSHLHTHQILKHPQHHQPQPPPLLLLSLQLPLSLLHLLPNLFMPLQLTLLRAFRALLRHLTPLPQSLSATNSTYVYSRHFFSFSSSPTLIHVYLLLVDCPPSRNDSLGCLHQPQIRRKSRRKGTTQRRNPLAYSGNGHLSSFPPSLYIAYASTTVSSQPTSVV